MRARAGCTTARYRSLDAVGAALLLLGEEATARGWHWARSPVRRVRDAAGALRCYSRREGGSCFGGRIASGGRVWWSVG